MYGLLKTCDFCGGEYEGKHMCWCKECQKKHPICNKCYENEIDAKRIISVNHLDNPERYT